MYSSFFKPDAKLVLSFDRMMMDVS
jgi:hypothetical protein